MAEPIRSNLSRLLMLGYLGAEPDQDSWHFLEESPPGAVLLFRHNIASQQQLAETLARIRDRCSRPGWPPLLVAVDQEGGRVARLTAEIDFPVFPAARELARTRSRVPNVRRAATITARGLRRLGINMNLAPVLDVVTDPDNRVIGDRSFGSDPVVVERLGLVAIEAIQKARVAASVKHFPGHGPTPVDSHLDLPVINLSRQELDAVHLPPFRAAIAAGVASIMTAHAVYPGLDPDRPATLSRAIITGILRQEWGYDGVVVTDSLTMQAIARHHTVLEACVMALEAGADLLMVPGSAALQHQCLIALESAVSSGRISRQRVEESLRRIHDLATRYA